MVWPEDISQFMVWLFAFLEQGRRPPSRRATTVLGTLNRRDQEASEERYRGIFQKARVALWDEDFSPVLEMLDRLRAEGVTDLRCYFRDQPKRLIEAIDLVRLNDVNEYTVELFEADRKADLLRSLASVFVPSLKLSSLRSLSRYGRVIGALKARWPYARSKADAST